MTAPVRTAEIPNDRQMAPVVTPDFAICPHCWHLNGPLSRVCLKCRSDMTLLLQESGGARWTAAVQSPVPVRGRVGLSRLQRTLLFGVVLLFCLGQVVYVFTPQRSAPEGGESSVVKPGG